MRRVRSIAAALVLAGSVSLPSQASTPSADIRGSWFVESVTDPFDATHTLRPNGRVELLLGNTQLTVRGGLCNRMKATYKLRRSALITASGQMTAVSCGPTSELLDYSLSLLVLGSTPKTVSISKTRLSISSGSTRVEAVRPASWTPGRIDALTPITPLDPGAALGTWRLDRIVVAIPNPAERPLPATAAVLRITAAGGTLELTCGLERASFQSEGPNPLSLSFVLTTPCPGEASFVINQLGSRRPATVGLPDANTLVLRYGPSELRWHREG